MPFVPLRLARLTNDPIPSFAIRNKITNFSLGAVSERLKDTPTTVIFSTNGVRRFKVIVGTIAEYACHYPYPSPFRSSPKNATAFLLPARTR
jgi:hypothetical protein